MKTRVLTTIEANELERTLEAILDVLNTNELTESEKILDLYDLRSEIGNSHGIIKGANIVAENKDVECT